MIGLWLILPEWWLTVIGPYLTPGVILLDSIRFTVVSEPPEEEEQERECEDVGMAYFSIPNILKQGQDMIETNLNSEFCAVSYP